MSPALRLRGVRKAYGSVQALDGLDIEVPRGVVCGLVGPNGAGKTTAFGIVGGVLRADAGEVDLLGAGRFDPRVHAGRVTLLPQDCELNPHTAVEDLLVFYGRLQGLSKTEANRDAARSLELVDLSDRRRMRVKQLSHGMRRRVAVAQAFLGDPDLVLLDEPNSGLDPTQVIRLRELFQAQSGRRTLIISSHVLHELQATCDFVVMMDKGVCTLSGPLDEVTRVGQRVTIHIEGEAPLEALRAALPDAQIEQERESIVVLGPPRTGVAELNARALRVLLDHDVPIESVERGQSLEARWLDTRDTASKVRPAPTDG